MRGRVEPGAVVREIVSGRLDGDALIKAVENIAATDLESDDLRSGATYVLDRWPYSTEPPINSAIWRTERACRDLREALLVQIVDRGDVTTLTGLARRPGVDGQLVARYARQAASRAAERTVTTVAPSDLLDVLSRGDARLVRTGADLVTALIAFFDRLQQRIGIGAHLDVWDSGKPLPGDGISDWVQRWMDAELPGRVVPDRELQVLRRKKVGIGDRADLTVTVGVGDDPIRAIIEAKTVGNSEVETALQAQLVERYLRPLGLRDGIFLVYWVRPDERPSVWSKSRGADREKLLAELQAQAQDIRADGFHVVPYVLDISPPG